MKTIFKISFSVILLGIITIIAIGKYKNTIKEPMTKKLSVSVTVPKEEQIDISATDLNYEEELDISKYTDLDGTKGLDLYVWKNNDKYYFGLLSGTNKPHTIEEKKELIKSPASIEEIKEILDTYKSKDTFVWKLNDSISDEELEDVKDSLKE